MSKLSNSQFKIGLDTSPQDVIDRVNNVLYNKYGLIIEEVNYNMGSFEDFYVILEIKKTTEQDRP